MKKSMYSIEKNCIVFDNIDGHDIGYFVRYAMDKLGVGAITHIEGYEYSRFVTLHVLWPDEVSAIIDRRQDKHG